MKSVLLMLVLALTGCLGAGRQSAPTDVGDSGAAAVSDLGLTTSPTSGAALPPSEAQPPTPLNWPDHPTFSPVALRPWRPPITLASNMGGNWEPVTFVAHDGTVYVAPISYLYRSTDGGRNFTDVTPPLMEGCCSDTSLSEGPDGALWWTAMKSNPGPTGACRSLDRGDTWTCNDLAIPGVTDRMWIVGTGPDEAYLQTNQGMFQNQWSRTTDGGATYVPYAGTTMTFGNENGNMVHDPTTGAVWQLQWSGFATTQLVRIDRALAVVSHSDTGLPHPVGSPILAIHNGTLWTTAEPVAPDGSHGVTLASSADEGRTWRSKQLPITPKTAALSSVAVGSGGRIAVAYYGANHTGAPADADADWAIYVIETENALDPAPLWREHRVAEGLHHGALCIGLRNPADDGDPNCRFAGDLLGISLDQHGNVHVSYAEERDGKFLLQYTRQDPEGAA